MNQMKHVKRKLLPISCRLVPSAIVAVFQGVAMTAASTVRPAATAVLNRLLRILSRSLPMYLREAKPWTTEQEQPIQAALADSPPINRPWPIASPGRSSRRGGQPEPGPFPTAFASVNDVDLAFVLQRVIDLGHRDLAALERCVADLGDVPELRALAEEILGNAQGHLDILQDLASPGSGA